MRNYNTGSAKNQKLRDIRTSARLTQDDMAKILGITRNAYQHLEAKGNLTGDILLKLSNHFKLPMEAFVDSICDPLSSVTQLREVDSHAASVPAYLTEEEADFFKILSTLSHDSKIRVLGYIMGLKHLEEENC